MKMSYLQLAVLSLIGGLLSPASAQGQKTYIGYVYPTGGAKGDEVIVELGGQKISDAKQVIISGTGITAEILAPLPEPNTGNKKKKRGKKKKTITDEDNIQIADRLRVRLLIAKDAEIGLRDVKVVGARGTVSNRLFFEVGQFPNVMESEPNGKLSEATPVAKLPAVLNGQVERGGRDCFRFSAKKGQKIVAEVKAQQLVPFLADAVPGWFQPVLTMYDAQGKEVAYSDDYQLSPDPTIVYEVPADGDYHLEIKDCIYRGREDFVYRIALGEIPHVTSAFPLGAKAGEKVSLRLYGVNLTSPSRQIKATKELGVKTVALRGDDRYVANEIKLEVSDDEEIVAHKDAGDAKKDAVTLKPGQVYNERIGHDYDQDWFRVDLKAGETLKFDVLSRRLGSQLDAYLCLYDRSGKLVAQSDDEEDAREGLMTHHADSQLIYTVPRNGSYYLRLTDRQNKYGNGYAYRMRYYNSAEDFSLSIEPSAISIPSGGTTHFTVFPVRMNGFSRPIQISAKDMPEGFILSDATLRGKGKSAKMSITAPPGAKPGRITFSVQGTATTRDGEEIQRVATPAEAMMQAFFITHLLPIDEFQVEVTPPAPFRIEVLNDPEDPIQLKAKTEVPLKLRIIRDEGYDKTIEFTLKGPKTVKSTFVKAGPKDKDVSLMLSCSSWRKAGIPLTIHVVAMEEPKAIKGTVGGKRNQLDSAVTVITPLIKVLTPAEAPPENTKKKNKKKNKDPKTVKT